MYVVHSYHFICFRNFYIKSDISCLLYCSNATVPVRSRIELPLPAVSIKLTANIYDNNNSNPKENAPYT